MNSAAQVTTTAESTVSNAKPSTEPAARHMPTDSSILRPYVSMYSSEITFPGRFAMAKMNAAA